MAAAQSGFWKGYNGPCTISAAFDFRNVLYVQMDTILLGHDIYNLWTLNGM